MWSNTFNHGHRVHASPTNVAVLEGVSFISHLGIVDRLPAGDFFFFIILDLMVGLLLLLYVHSFGIVHGRLMIHVGHFPIASHLEAGMYVIEQNPRKKKVEFLKSQIWD
jgi:hypothetical protein